MAKTFTNDEKREIEEKAKYILAAMDDIGKNGDAYCTDEQLFRASKAVRPSLTGQRYRTDKALLLQAGFLHQEGYHLYAKRTWDYEVTAAERLADILKAPALPVMEILRELRAGDILLSEQQREAIELALNSRLSVILGGAALSGGREHSGPLAGEGKNRLFGAGAQHAPAERSQPADGGKADMGKIP